MKRITWMLLCILLIFAGAGYVVQQRLQKKEQSVSIAVQDQKNVEIDLHSKHAILIEQDTGKVLLQKHADKRIAIASLTKIMTVYVALKQMPDIQKTIEIPSSIYPHLVEENASVAGLLAEELVTIEDLLHATLLASGAEAAISLAIASDGDEVTFVKRMNAEAERLGMKNTHFTNCIGLDDKNHYSSVKDISILLQTALKDERFQQIFHSRQYWMISNLHPDGLMINSTLWQSVEQHALQANPILGGKTGFTNAAGLCLASQGRIHGKTYIFVSAGAIGDGESEPYHILDAIRTYGALT